MKRGYLSEYFEGVALKRLSAVEADETRSNQHEYNATRAMLDFMGRPSDAIRIPTRFIYLDDENDPLVEDAFLTLYDTRANQPHRSARSEEHTSELQSLMRISYAVFCLKKKKQTSNYQ